MKNGWIGIKTNPKFWPLREYLYKLALQLSYYKKNSMFLDYAINDIAQTEELKLNNYSLELLKTLLFVSLGDSIGIRPSINNDALPQNELYALFSEGNKNDLAPIIIEPHMSRYRKDKEPFYYSLDAFNNTINMQKTFKSFHYLNTLSETIDQMLHHFKEHPLTKTTVYNQLSDHVEFNYYSERGNDSIRKIDTITDFDSRFDRILNESHLKVPKRSIISKALIAMNYK